MVVRMELSRILIREMDEYQIIELRELLSDEDRSAGQQPRSFPIVIGLPEAMAIDRRLKGFHIKRPQTHDLLATAIRELGGELISITINDLSDHTFFAMLDIRSQNDLALHIDCRPSDAIAIGIAGKVPIYVEEHVLESITRHDV